MTLAKKHSKENNDKIQDSLTEPGTVTFYDIWSGNVSGLACQSASPGSGTNVITEHRSLQYNNVFHDVSK